MMAFKMYLPFSPAMCLLAKKCQSTEIESIFRQRLRGGPWDTGNLGVSPAVLSGPAVPSDLLYSLPLSPIPFFISVSVMFF